jgi:hypothetical protein
MTTTDRRQARHANRQAAHHTEIWVIGTAAETTSLLLAMRATGRLVSASPPHPVGSGDPRYRLYLRLRNT